MTLVLGCQTNLLACDAKWLKILESKLLSGRSCRGNDGVGLQLATRAMDPGRQSRGRVRQRKMSPPIRMNGLGVLKLAMEEERAMIMAIAFRDQEMEGHCLPSDAIERNSNGAVLVDKVGAAFQHRDSSPPDRGLASCLNRSFSESEMEKFLLGDSVCSLRGFSGPYMDSTREEETLESEEEYFSAAAPNIQVEKQIATNHENSRSWSFSANPPRRKRLPIMIRKGILLEASSSFRHRGRNDEIYTNRVEGLESRVLPHSRKVTKFRRLSVGGENATSKTIGIVHLAKSGRKKSETAVGHGIAKHLWVDLINLKNKELDVKRCKGRLPTNSMSTASRIVSATTDQHYIDSEDHKENIPPIAGVVQMMTIGHPARTFFVPDHVHMTTCKDVIRIPQAVIQDDDMITVEDAGEPNIPCDSCKGKGWLVCDFCEGQKVNVQSPRNNRIYRRCPNCKAVGVVICPRCKVFKCVSCPDEKDTDVTL